ncbi:hypothetical protein OsJ_23440 [Oryza sativa Japonica Group]|uniref:Uncharacterized protein n=1 Tax=Oryza sativa subsp. japonica TaxID=39947 RepID=B9FW06_ORYSJ|nr:hypothetical protein OsJ_23440 [Oryza sativa Japonica Group]
MFPFSLSSTGSANAMIGLYLPSTTVFWTKKQKYQQGLKISRCSAQPCNCVGRCCNGSTLEHPWCGLKPVRDKAIDDCFRTATPTRIKLGDGGTSFWVDDWFPDSGAVANLVPIVSTSVKPEKWTVASI